MRLFQEAILLSSARTLLAIGPSIRFCSGSFTLPHGLHGTKSLHPYEAFTRVAIEVYLKDKGSSYFQPQTQIKVAPKNFYCSSCCPYPATDQRFTTECCFGECRSTKIPATRKLMPNVLSPPLTHHTPIQIILDETPSEI